MNIYMDRNQVEYLLTKINKKRCLYAKGMIKILFDDPDYTLFNIYNYKEPNQIYYHSVNLLHY